MKSLEELRELACDMNSNEIVGHMKLYPNCVFDGEWLDSWHREFDRLLDEIEREIAERYLPIPCDGDGILIRFGDKVREVDDNVPMEVRSLTYYADCCVDVNSCGMYPNLLVHVKPRTLEDVLTDRINDVLCVMTSGIPIALETALNDSFGEECADEIRELLGGDGR